MRLLGLSFAVFAAGCGTHRGGSADAWQRPVIDPAPYYEGCADSGTCPEPYECVEATASHERVFVCLVPCSADEDCPTGHFCNGVNASADIGAPDHCVEDV